MKHFFWKHLVGLLLLSFLSVELAAQGKYSWDFEDCEIRDILYAVSVDTGISITPDDTVYGKTGFRFSGSDFETAFEAFLVSCRLYVQKNEKIWYVSRFRAVENEGLFSVDFCDLNVSSALEKLSVFLGKPVTYDGLPVNDMSLHLSDVTEDEVLGVFVRNLNGYELVKKEKGWHIAKLKSAGTGFDSDFWGYCSINLDHNIETRDDESADDQEVTVDVKDCSFRETCEKLMDLYQKEFCFLSPSDTKTVRCHFKASGFEQALNRICSMNGFSYIERDEIYYLFSDLNAKNALSEQSRSWEYFATEYLSSLQAINLIKQRFGNLEIITMPDKRSFISRVTETELSDIKKLLKEIDKSDIEEKTYLINLKNLKADDFLQIFPETLTEASLPKGKISRADNNNGIFFTGTISEYKDFVKQLEIFDKPPLRLRYDLLILQYDETASSEWKSGITVRNLKKGDRSGVSAILGSVMNLSLNVVAAFGLDFAANLQTSINQNQTKVFADTTLYGVAGKNINFQNSTTYRYRDNNLDPETGKPLYTGITKEIISGLKLDITGWVSGDGKITSSVKASVSRRGTDTSAVTGNPPPTTEKILTTEVVGFAGEPVILTGLVQTSEAEDVSRTPFLSRIPIVGHFFKGQGNNREKTQMVIYLVPHIENVSEEKGIGNLSGEKYDKKWAESQKEELCRILM